MKKAKNIIDLEIKIEQGTLVACSDIHFPFQDDKAVDAFLNYIRVSSPKYIVLNGDLLDMYMLSRFTKGEGRNPFEEMQMCKEFLKKIREVAPKAKIFYTIGNHECFDGRTDVLTNKGWVNIKDLVVNKDDYYPICFDMETKQLCCGHFSHSIVRKAESKLVAIETANTKQIVTPMHNVLYDDELSYASIVPVEDLQKHIRPCAVGDLHTECYHYTKNVIELITLVVADGTITQKPLVQIKVSKPQKIEYVEQVLTNNNIKFTKAKATMSSGNKLQPYVFRVYGEDAKRIIKLCTKDGVKQLPDEFRALNPENVEHLIEAIIKTDGSRDGQRNYFYSKNKHDIDLVQELMVTHGYSAKYRTNKSGFKAGSESYALIFSKNYDWCKKLNSVTLVDSSDGNVYCLETDKGTLVTRIDGKTAITGNCRLEKTILSKAPELESLFENVFQLLKLEDLDIRGCARLIINNDVIFKHGTLLGNKSGLSAIKEMENAYSSGVSGHTHRLCKYIARKAGRKFFWIESGCLCRLDPEYMVDPNWQQGFAELKFIDGRVYDAKVIEIEDGVIL